MLSNILDRLSFVSLFLVIVLLPIFFLPLTSVSIETSKGLLLVIGLVLSIVFWMMARFKDGRITLPKSLLLLSGLGIVLAFLISASFSSAPQASFFGTMFDLGSFWFIFALFLLMFISSILFKDPKKAMIVLFGLMFSSAVVLIFQTFHLFLPETLSLGTFTSKTSNIFGSWNAFGVFAGFFCFISLFMVEFFSISRINKLILGILMILSLFLISAVNSSLAWEILGVFALIIFIYKISFSLSENNTERSNTHFPILSFLIMIISILFLFSSEPVVNFVPSKLQLSNIEISPSFSSTMSVAKSAFLQNPVLGIGPNRFGDIWAMYKPTAVNSSDFWDTSFNFGSGLLPTLVSTVGMLGLLSFVIFFFLFLLDGLKSVFSGIKNGVNQVIAIFFAASLYLFVASFFYPVGSVIFILAFTFTGIFIGLLNSDRSNGEITLTFSGNPKKSFFSLFLLVSAMITFSVLGFKYIERFVSISYFAQALSADKINVAESNIIKANQLYQNDLYLRTYSQVYISKLNSLASQGSSLSETDRASLQPNLNQAINGAQAAIAFNKDNYQNFTMLGSVYNIVASFGVDGAYEKAKEAYKQAEMLNPANPGIKLAMARILFTENKIKEAKDYANVAFSLKPNYIDALVVLSQIAKSEGKNTDAIAYGEQALSFAPQDKILVEYVNSLKNTNTSSVSQESKKTQ